MSVLRDLANQNEYGGAQEKTLAPIGTSAIARASTLSENLEAKKIGLEQQLARVNAALDALKANPNFEEIMLNLLSQV